MTKDQMQIIRDALDNEDVLTSWETKFIEDIGELPDTFVLSEAQEATLSKIEDKLIDEGRV